jgi:cbb3-type cytochrome oxidase cytochrome c subunit
MSGSKVKPLYKKGDGYDVQNYRPKSVLSIISKLIYIKNQCDATWQYVY